MSKMAKSKKIIPRDISVLKCAQGELNLGTRVINDKTTYTRKTKHKTTLEW